MPFPLMPDAEAEILSGRMGKAMLVDLYSADSEGNPTPIRFWDRPGVLSFPANDLVPGAGRSDPPALTDVVAYRSLRGRFQVSREIRFTATLASEPLKITLDGSRSSEDDDIVGQWVDSLWHERNVRVRQVALSKTTGRVLAGAVWEWTGRMDYRQRPRQAAQTLAWELTCQPGLFRVQGRNMHTRTHADQQRRKAGDLFFRDTPVMVALAPVWGRETANLPGVRNVVSGAGGGSGGNGATTNEKF
jgi:hypothetical protein